jgi:hypothetical protein
MHDDGDEEEEERKRKVYITDFLILSSSVTLFSLLLDKCQESH